MILALRCRDWFHFLLPYFRYQKKAWLCHLWSQCSPTQCPQRGSPWWSWSPASCPRLRGMGLPGLLLLGHSSAPGGIWEGLVGAWLMSKHLRHRAPLLNLFGKREDGKGWQCDMGKTGGCRNWVMKMAQKGLWEEGLGSGRNGEGLQRAKKSEHSGWMTSEITFYTNKYTGTPLLNSTEYCKLVLQWSISPNSSSNFPLKDSSSANLFPHIPFRLFFILITCVILYPKPQASRWLCKGGGCSGLGGIKICRFRFGSG